jgi:hypothetical protein
MTELAVREEMTSIIDSLARGEQGDSFVPIPPKLKIVSAAAVFQDDNSGNTMSSIQCIILASLITRGYWVEGDKTPICTSLGGRTGVSRETSVIAGGECAQCKFNQFGSDPKGRGGKACKEMRRLLIMPKEWSMPALLSLPPTSIRVFDKYASSLLALRSAYFATETLITLEKMHTADGMDYSVVKFSASNPLTRDQLDDVSDFRDQYKTFVAGLGVSAEELENA